MAKLNVIYLNFSYQCEPQIMILIVESFLNTWAPQMSSKVVSHSGNYCWAYLRFLNEFTKWFSTTSSIFEHTWASKLLPTTRSIFKCVDLEPFSTFELCYVGNSVILFHCYFYACIDIDNLTRGPLTGELVVRLSNCTISHIDMIVGLTTFPQFFRKILNSMTWSSVNDHVVLVVNV